MNAKALLTFLVGMVSLFLLLYFYLAQRDFERNYKNVRDLFYNMDKSYYIVSNETLRSSLYAYYNHDSISSELNRLSVIYDELRSQDVWRKKHYYSIAKQVVAFDTTLNSYEEAIYDFIMLNSSVRNSFVFLTSLSNNNLHMIESEPELYFMLLSIVSDISKTRLLGDTTFLDDLDAKISDLKKYRDSSANVGLIDTFLLHASSIRSSFPALSSAFNEIDSIEFHNTLHTIEQQYLKASREDYLALDRLVLAMVFLFILAMLMIIALLIRADRENIRLRELKNNLRHALSHDQLTELSSRRRFEVMLREFKKPTLILLNIDRFKHINDFYGIGIGNKILRELALLIQMPGFSAYNPSFFRLGGDDFGIVLQDVDRDRALKLAIELKRMIDTHTFKIDSVDLNITVSMALNSVLPLFENADLALMHEKDNRSGLVLFFSESMGLKERSQNNLKVMSEVKQALELDNIAPWFQPIVSLHNNKIVKYEALVRLHHIDGRVGTPDTFLPIVLATPYYQQITIKVLEKTIEAIAQSSLRFSMNISMRDLADERLVSSFLKVLDMNRSEASRLDIELLESEELNDLDLIRSFLLKVKEYGCHIAIDDFGSGYSNFSYIVELPIDILKIDGSLISQMLYDRNKYIAVKSIVSFASSLGLEIIAEYVEDADIAKELSNLGVQNAQGYHFGRPKKDVA